MDGLVERDRDPTGSGTLSERLYVQQDANWNVTAVVSSAGVVQERYIYDPYGRPTVLAPDWSTRGSSAFAWVYLHQGGRYDNITGLYSFRNRDYSSTLGTWIQRDPIGYAAGDPNIYRYVRNNPILRRDPSGLMTPDECFEAYTRLYNHCQKMQDPDARLRCQARAFKWYQECLNRADKPAPPETKPLPDPVPTTGKDQLKLRIEDPPPYDIPIPMPTPHEVGTGLLVLGIGLAILGAVGEFGPGTQGLATLAIIAGLGMISGDANPAQAGTMDDPELRLLPVSDCHAYPGGCPQVEEERPVPVPPCVAVAGGRILLK